MILLVQNLIEACDLISPKFTVAIPPSDNVRLSVGRKGQKFLSKKAKEYINEYSKLRPLVPKPPCILIYKVYFKKGGHKRDPSNITKVMLDALFLEDVEVYPWCMPPGMDNENPRVDLWFVETESETQSGIRTPEGAIWKNSTIALIDNKGPDSSL